MKKLVIFLMLALVFIVPVIAQDPEIPEPKTIWDVIVNIAVFLASFKGVCVITLFLTSLLTGLLKITKKWLKQGMAWIVAIAIFIVSDLFNFGYAATFPLWLAAVHGVGAGLVANGIFDIPFVKSILDKIDEWGKKK